MYRFLYCGAVFSAVFIFAASASPAPQGTFSTTAAYVRDCDTATISDACRQAFVNERFDRIGKVPPDLCMPSDAIGATNPSKAVLDQAYVKDLREMLAWLKAHPQPPEQKWTDGLDAAMYALYICMDINR
jgi:hypothetical protein